MTPSEADYRMALDLLREQTQFMAKLMMVIVGEDYDKVIPEIGAALKAHKGLGAKCVKFLKSQTTLSGDEVPNVK